MEFTCDECGYEFSRLYNLRRHMRNKHEDEAADLPKRRSVVIEKEGFQPESDSEDDADVGDVSGDDTMKNSSDESEGEEDNDKGETEKDPEIPDTMANLMYICCQLPEKRQEMLRKLDDDKVKVICECCTRVLKGDIPVNYTEKDTLREFKEVMRSLRDPKQYLDDKKEIIVQNGRNFLLSLIPTVVGALTAMFK